MRSDIYSMWSIQENLLQQYRIIAITLLGLISAGILVAVAQIRDKWDQIDGAVSRLATLNSFDISTLLIFFLLVNLLGLGILTSNKMRGITDHRGRLVTFYQNMLIAEETDQLKKICERYELSYPANLVQIHRRIENLDATSLTFEPRLNHDQLKAFLDEIKQTGGENELEKDRHYFARSYLKAQLYIVFDIFFLITAAFAALTVSHALGVI